MLRAPLLLAAAGLLAAQDQPDLKVTTRLVQVGVVVRDHAGKPVPLTKDDFEILDNGARRPVTLFVPATGVDSAAARPVVTLPPNVFSNRYERNARTVNVILLDALNTPSDRHAATVAQLDRLLQGVKSRQYTALYVLDTSLKVLHDFTDNPERLRRALAAYKIARTTAVDLNPGRTALGENLGMRGTIVEAAARAADARATADMASVSNVNRFQITHAALVAIVRHIRHIPGRKSLVWVSQSFPMSLPSNGTNTQTRDVEIREWSRTLADADVAIYPVSNRGLRAMTSMSAENEAGGSRRPVANPGDRAPAVDFGMRELAEATGGRGFFGTNDLTQAVEQAMDDGAASYTLGFYPEESTLDGGFHRLQVKVKGKGYTIRHRAGYLATRETPVDRPTNLDAAAASPFSTTAVAFSLRADSSDEPKPGSLRLIIGIDASTLHLAEAGDHRTGAVDVLVVQQNAVGAALGGMRFEIQLDPTNEAYQQLLRDGVVVVKYLEPVPGVWQLRVLVQDRNSGGIGSVLVPGVPELLKPATGPKSD